MRRGQIHIANLGPPFGAEPVHARPVVIVRNDGANMSTARIGCGVVTVVPLTTNTGRIYPFQVFVAAADTGLGHDSKAQAEQVRSIAVERIGRTVGSLTFDLMALLDDALRLHLSL